MNPVGLIDFITFIVTVFSVITVLVKWKNQFSLVIKLSFLSFVLIVGFYYLSNFLEWSGLSTILVNIEDYIALLAPLLFFFFLFIYIQNKSEEEIREKEKKFRTLFNSAGDAILFHDLDGKMLEVNRTACEKLGYSREELLQMTPMDLDTPEYAALVPERIKELVQKGSSFYKSAHVSKEGVIIPIELSIRTIDYEGRKAVLSIARDVTEPIKIKGKLRKEREKGQLYLDLVSVIIIVLNKNGEIILLNKKGYECLEYEEGELEGKNFFEICLPNDIKEEVYSVYKKLMIGELESVEFYENPIITKKGKIKIIEWHNTNIYHKNGNIKGTISSGEDITERKKAEQKLKESEEKFRLIAEQSLLGIHILQDDVFKFANQAIANILEYSIEELLNWTPKEYIKAIYQEDLAFVVEQGRKKQQGERECVINYAWRAVTKSGMVKWVETYSKTITWDGKKADMVITNDISERKKAENITKNELNRLKEIDNIKEDLIRRISHELNTPLISIYSTSDLIIDHYSKNIDSELLELIEIIYRGGQRLKTLFDNLMDIYSIDSQRLGVDLNPTNLVDIINQSISKVRAIYVNRKHEFCISLPEKIVLNIDSKRIMQVLKNLISNAVKFTPVKGLITVKLTENQDHVEISIQDNGIGFTSEEKNNIFTKFGKIERYGKGFDVDIEGPGLGLFIANEIILLHDGKLILNSEGRNKGSTFIIKLKKQ